MGWGARPLGGGRGGGAVATRGSGRVAALSRVPPICADAHLINDALPF